MSDFMNYIDPKLGVIVIVLWCIGLAIKQLKNVKDEYIPVLLSLISIVLVSAFFGALNVNSIIQGVLCAAASVYGNQMFKQFNKAVASDINSAIPDPVVSDNSVEVKKSEQNISGT
jgi:hypothetical protein